MCINNNSIYNSNNNFDMLGTIRNNLDWIYLDYQDYDLINGNYFGIYKNKNLEVECKDYLLIIDLDINEFYEGKEKYGNYMVINNINIMYQEKEIELTDNDYIELVKIIKKNISI